MYQEILGTQCKYNYASVFAQRQGSSIDEFSLWKRKSLGFQKTFTLLKNYPANRNYSVQLTVSYVFTLYDLIFIVNQREKAIIIPCTRKTEPTNKASATKSFPGR